MEDTVLFADLEKQWKVDAPGVAKRTGASLSSVKVTLLRRDMESVEVDFNGFDVTDVEGGKAAVLSWLRSLFNVKIVRGAASMLRAVVSRK